MISHLEIVSQTRQVNGLIIAFGGVDREQTHFNDAIIFRADTGKWTKAEQKGAV